MKRLKKNGDKLQREIPLGGNPGIGLIGLGNSGKRNLSENHDKYFARYARQKKG
jgi:hypothetical protein